VILTLPKLPYVLIIAYFSSASKVKHSFRCAPEEGWASRFWAASVYSKPLTPEAIWLTFMPAFGNW